MFFVAISAFVYHQFLDESLFIIFFKGEALWKQLLTGTVFGLVASFFAWRIIQSDILREVRNFFVKFLKPFNFRIFDIVFISLSAGIGEELLFRASVQPFLTIWPTAVLFVFLHGYLSIRNWQLSIYGVYMVFVAAGFGYLYREIGIVSAIAAHTVIDIILLLIIRSIPMPESAQNQGIEESGMPDDDDEYKNHHHHE